MFLSLKIQRKYFEQNSFILNYMNNNLYFVVGRDTDFVLIKVQTKINWRRKQFLIISHL